MPAQAPADKTIDNKRDMTNETSSYGDRDVITRLSAAN
jgi:hypothetical protein